MENTFAACPVCGMEITVTGIHEGTCPSCGPVSPSPASPNTEWTCEGAGWATGWLEVWPGCPDCSYLDNYGYRTG